MKRLLRLLTVGATLLFTASLAFAQTGTIQGILVDGSGAAVPNAKVTATDEAKQLVARETVSATDGHFYLRNIQPGKYTLKLEASGFKTVERPGLQLDQNQIMDLGAITFQIGQTSESITIESTVPVVETSTANKSFVVTSRQVTELSLNGRDFQSLMRTLPGVVSNDRSSFRLAFNNTDAFNVNGLRGSMNNVFLDGSINTDVGANDGQFTQISLDAVGEFKVQTSTFNAEYGRNPGVFISINTKSGGKNFHGTAYEFFRNNALDARVPFDTTGKVAKLRFNQYGGNLSGPIYLPKVSTKSDPRLFFFFNFEGTRASRPIGGNFVDLPHPDLFNGDLSRLYRNQPLLTSTGQPTGFQVGQVFRPGTVVRESNGRIIGGSPYVNNLIPKSEWAKNATGFINVLKFFNVSGDPGTPNIPEQVRHPYQQNYGFEKDAKVGRVDWAISSKMNFFFRWADDAQQETQTLGIFATLPSPIFPQFRKKPGSSWSYNLVNVISPTMTNEFIFGYNRLTQLVDNTTDADPSIWDKDKLGFTYKELYDGVNLRNRFPRFNCGVGSCNYGSAFPSGWLSEAKQFAFTDNFSVIRGSHSLKFGGLFNFNLNGQQPSWTDVPNINFGSNVENINDSGSQFTNMLLGNYTSVSQSNGRFYGNFKFYGFEWYAQDSWRVNRKLNLEFGIRWAYMGPTFTQGQFLQNYFDPRLYDPTKAVQIDTRSGLRNGSIVPGSGDPFNGLIQEGKGGIPQGFAQHRFNNWGPRFGFAYDPWGNGKTSIRGGAGIFYERIRQNVNNFDGLGNPPLAYTPSVYVGNIDNLGPQLVASGTRFPVSLSTFDAAGQIPTIYSWSFGIQRELPWSMSLDASYVGNAGRHLQYRRDLNMLPLGYTLQPGVLAAVNNTTNALRPYKGFTNVNFTEYGSNSNYNALQVRLSRRFAKNLTGNFNYTWAKTFSEVDGDGTAIGYAYDRNREYGLASYDRTHIATIDFVYELPFFSNASRALKASLGGWQLNGIARFWNGPPAGISSNGDAGQTVGGIRANYLGGDLYPTTKDRYNYFNVYSFGRPLNGSLGNTGKTVIRLPGINEWDMSLFKNVRISERMNFQIRWETFNTLNHTQWSGVNTGLSLPNPGMTMVQANKGTFGEVNSTRDPRTMQIALKFLF